MQPKTQSFTTFISNSSYELWHKVRIKAVDRILRKMNTIHNKILRRGPKKPQDFLYSALYSHRRNNADHAICTLEVGLKNYPGAESLLENYLRICCEQEQFARAIDFINSGNKQLHKTLAGTHIADPNQDHQLIDDRQKHGLVWLTEKVINENFDDLVPLWRLADLLEHAGRSDAAKKIYHKLSNRVTNNLSDCLYAGISEMRLGNFETGFKKLKQTAEAYPEAENVTSVFDFFCYSRFDLDRYMQFTGVSNNEEMGESRSALNFYRNALKLNPPETFILKFVDIRDSCDSDNFQLLKEEFLTQLRENGMPVEKAKLSLFFSRYLDLEPEFTEKLFLVLYSLNWGENDKTAKYLLAIIHKLTPPIVLHHTSELEEVVRQFTIDAHALAQQPIELIEPYSDLVNYWAPWQSLFCLVQPRLYRHAISALETLALRLWPKLDYIAPHINRSLGSQGMSRRKIRIGFTVLDSMPMMSGFTALLDRDIFETVFLRPGKSGESGTASDWIARAGTTVEYSDADPYAAITTIANQELDILITGSNIPQIFFPLLARLAHLHMVLLEPNWPDGIKNIDYYISWQKAEPENYKDFYQTPVSLLQNPPYWIERPTLAPTSAISDETSNKIRQRLLSFGPNERFYVCPNTPPKIHPAMDEILCRLLEADTAASLVLLRGNHSISRTIKARLREKLGRYYERVIFLDTLPRDDAHSLLLSADCCLDSYPLCGMSSSFDGLMLGVPIVTLPTETPFGRWTAAIYEYIGVSDLTARDIDDYISIAMRLAIDKDWRLKKSAEIREKASRYIESRVSFDEFQHFIVEAWRRKQAGLPPENWVAGEWQ